MNISKTLPRAVTLEYQDEDWQQTLDYEHIPFRCRRCHEHGHLFIDFPLIKPATKANDTTQKDGFTMVAAKKRNSPTRQIPDPRQKITTKNSYQILNQLPKDEEIQDPHKELQQAHGDIPNPPPPPQSCETYTEERGDGDGDTPMHSDNRDLAGIDLEKLKEALNQKDRQTLPEEQLCKVHKVFLNSSTGSTTCLGIATNTSSGSKRVLRENKRRGRKTTQQLIKEVGKLMINSVQIHKLLKGYLHPTPPS